MFKLAFFLLVVASAVAFAQGPVLTENFDDGDFNGNLWTVFNDGIGPSANERNGCVDVEIPADAHEADAPHSFGGGLKSAKCLRGDFDIQIDYYLLDWPAASGVRVGLELFPARSGQMGNVNRSSFGPAENGPTESYVADYQTVSGAVPTAHDRGSFRLARIGNRLTSGMLIDGEWVELYIGDFSTENYYFAFTAWSHDYAFAHVPVRVAFDNFIIRFGELVDPSAPAASVSSNVTRPKPVITAPRATALQSCQVVGMPYGRPFFRMPEAVTPSVPSRCGPYPRLHMSLPSQGSGIKPLVQSTKGR